MTVSSTSNSDTKLRKAWARAIAIGLAGATLVASGSRAEAAVGTGEPGRFGFVLEANAEYGGDDLVKVFYRDGSTQDIRAGQGVSVAAGVHYQPYALPIDFAATVGYKYIGTDSYRTDLSVDRVVFKLTGTYLLPQHFWIVAGPVWHTATKLRGDGYVPDINFDDSVGGLVGVGWRWFDVTYTDIKYHSPLTGSVDGSNVGVGFIWKF